MGTGGVMQTVTFSNSTTFGWNEVQAMVGGDRTNQNHVGFTLRIDPGLYTFTSPLVISNTMNFDGGNPASCIFEYVGPTNVWTMHDLTNLLSEQALEAGVNLSLMSFCTNAVAVPGEDGNNINCILKNFSLVTSTDMYCVGIGNISGDHTLLQNVWVGGPQLFNSRNAHSGWVDLSDIPEPSGMIGFVTGVNQVVLRDCSAFAVADGVVSMGDSLVTLDHFNGVCCGNCSSNNGATAFPNTSELSLGAAIMIPAKSGVETMVISGNSLSYKCGHRLYVGNRTPVAVYDYFDQFSLHTELAVLCTSRPRATVTRLGSSLHTPLLAVTNGPDGFGVDPRLPVEFFPHQVLNEAGNADYWWSTGLADVTGGIGMSVIAFFSGLVGWLASRRRAKYFVFVAVKYLIVLGVLLMIAGLVVAACDLPYLIWCGLLFSGLTLILIFSMSRRSIRRRYDGADISKTTSVK